MRSKQLVWDVLPPNTLTWEGIIPDEAYVVIDSIHDNGGCVFVCAYDSATDFMVTGIFTILNKTPIYQTGVNGACVMADSDGSLCVINDPANGLILKNRLGASYNCMFNLRIAI